MIPSQELVEYNINVCISYSVKVYNCKICHIDNMNLSIHPTNLFILQGRSNLSQHVNPRNNIHYNAKLYQHIVGNGWETLF